MVLVVNGNVRPILQQFKNSPHLQKMPLSGNVRIRRVRSSLIDAHTSVCWGSDEGHLSLVQGTLPRLDGYLPGSLLIPGLP